MASSSDRWQRLEGLFYEALELEPDKPDLLNNLAMAFDMQNRKAASHALIRDVHRTLAAAPAPSPERRLR